MSKKTELEVIQEMQAVLEQMKLDDIEEDPSSQTECFNCDCCAKTKPLAGSVLYATDCRLCNDCALLAEISFSLNKISNIQEFIDLNEDNRLAELCEYIKQDEQKENN